VREELSDGKVTIKKIKPEHIQFLFATIFESREKLEAWLPWCHSDYNIGETIGWVNYQQIAWEEKLEYSFGIFECKSNQLVGGCGLNQMNWIYNIGNLGYWMGTKYTGKGFASAATKLCAEFGFTDLKLNRIEIVAAEGNIPSQRVAEKAGATKECLARRRLLVGDKLHDAFVYSLIKEDLTID